MRLPRRHFLRVAWGAAAHFGKIVIRVAAVSQRAVPDKAIPF